MGINPMRDLKKQKSAFIVFYLRVTTSDVVHQVTCRRTQGGRLYLSAHSVNRDRLRVASQCVQRER